MRRRTNKSGGLRNATAGGLVPLLLLSSLPGCAVRDLSDWSKVQAVAPDTLGYVEYGPDGGNCFAKWLDDCCDLGKVGVTSDELWELRNSLIHMTNLDSRKVRSGKTHRLLPRFMHPDRDVAPLFDGMKVLHVTRFVIIVLPEGIESWLRSYNRDRAKFGEFVERYDTIVSEARLRLRDQCQV